MPIIRDIMSKSIVTIRSDATMIDAVRTLVEHRFSGAPVVSAEGEPVGFLSELELMDVLFDQDVRSAPVSEYMARGVHVVHPDESLASAARVLTLFGIRRLPVVENGTLVGMVTHRDMLSYCLHHPEPLAEPLVELIPALGQFA
jgi:CBS domain-containing protein